jgi:hypothetical protein
VSWGTESDVEKYAVGFARPDRWVQPGPADDARPWHAVEAHRPLAELDGEVELAVCGAIVQVWGRQDWNRVGVGRTACGECQRLTAVLPATPVPRTAAAARLRVAS